MKCYAYRARVFGADCMDCGKAQIGHNLAQQSCKKTPLELAKRFRHLQGAFAEIGCQQLVEELEDAAVLLEALKEPKPWQEIIAKLRKGLGAGGSGCGMWYEIELGNILLDKIADAFEKGL